MPNSPGSLQQLHNIVGVSTFWDKIQDCRRLIYWCTQRGLRIYLRHRNNHRSPAVMLGLIIAIIGSWVLSRKHRGNLRLCNISLICNTAAGKKLWIHMDTCVGWYLRAYNFNILFIQSCECRITRTNEVTYEEGAIENHRTGKPGWLASHAVLLGFRLIHLWVLNSLCMCCLAVTTLAIRLFGYWMFSLATVRLLCAYNIYNRQWVSMSCLVTANWNSTLRVYFRMHVLLFWIAESSLKVLVSSSP